MNLVVQGPGLAEAHLRALAQLSGAQRIERLDPRAGRLIGARDAPDIAGYCAGAGLDFGSRRNAQ